MFQTPVLKPIAAGVLSATIALTSLSATARPAQALEAETVGQLLLGAAAVAVVAKLYDDYRDDREAASAPPVQQAAAAPIYAIPLYQPPQNTAQVHKARAPRPIRCSRRLQTKNGWVRFFSQPCLDRVGAEASVPRTCLRQRWNDDRWIQYFSRRCLEKYGAVEDA